MKFVFLKYLVGRGGVCYSPLVPAVHAGHGKPGAGRSSEVERSLMVRWVVGSILHGYALFYQSLV